MGELTDNRFADCETIQNVLWRYHELARDGQTEYVDAALARIRELTPPPTVSEEARERALKIALDWLGNRGMTSSSARGLVDDIIGALGYDPEPEPTEDCSKCGDHQFGVEPVCKRCQMVMTTDTTAPTPVVDLDADDLETIGDRIRDWSKVALNLDVDETHQIPTGIGQIVHNGVAWVLRIGGGDE